MQTRAWAQRAGIASRRVAFAGALAMALAGCSSTPSVQGSATQSAASMATPVLALPPAALGCNLAVQQRLTVLAPGQAPQSLEALLEVDAQQVQLALFHMGQRMGTLVWNGQQLHTDLSRWWPQVLQPEQVLSDMQLALWPVQAVRQALPADWRMDENHSARSLSDKLQERISVIKTSAHALEIVYAPAGWRLRIESPGGMQPCTASTQGF